MRVRNQTKPKAQPTPQLPPAAAPRRVRLSLSGYVLLACAAVLITAAPVAGLALYSRANSAAQIVERFASEGVATKGEVLNMRRAGGEESHTRIRYRYTAGGQEYNGSSTLRKRDRNRFSVGSPVRLRYLASQPGTSWIDGYGPSPESMMWALLVPPAFLFVAVCLLLPIRYQARLLEEGRFAVATVKKYGKKVQYEWTLLSGAKRSAGFAEETTPAPVPGTSIPIVYDRDNPNRHARYPLSLVKVAGLDRRAAAGLKK